MPYRSTTSWPVSSRRLSNTGTGNAALPETRSRAPRSAAACTGDSAILLQTVGTPKNSVAPAPAAAAYRSGVRATRVHQAAAGPERTEDAEHESVHVEEGQPVGEDVVARPRPGVGEAVETRGERGAGERARPWAGRSSPRCRARRRRRRRAPSPVCTTPARPGRRARARCRGGPEGRRRASARGHCRRAGGAARPLPSPGVPVRRSRPPAVRPPRRRRCPWSASRARRHVHGRPGARAGRRRRHRAGRER